MASTLCQKWLTILCQKAQNFVYNCVQISPAYGPNTYQIIYGEPLDFQCQKSAIIYTLFDKYLEIETHAGDIWTKLLYQEIKRYNILWFMTEKQKQKHKKQNKTKKDF